MTVEHSTEYVDSEGESRCVDCDKWLEPGYYDIEDHAKAMDMKTCAHCGESIRPNQTGGWYHTETAEHRSDQRCFLYATPESTT